MKVTAPFNMKEKFLSSLVINVISYIALFHLNQGCSILENVLISNVLNYMTYHVCSMEAENLC